MEPTSSLVVTVIVVVLLFVNSTAVGNYTVLCHMVHQDVGQPIRILSFQEQCISRNGLNSKWLSINSHNYDILSGTIKKKWTYQF